MSTPDSFGTARWIKSSYSSGEGECVEVAGLPGAVAARDSKSLAGPVLVFACEDWAGFVRGVSADEFRP
ncbi:DUF397 domain-containing protein [Streptomyces sp. NPDC056716]|uniref:DUF397 domain-containing protein n=1 Tax=unclassified Streptomyces TaxID=2593676 RepID=UPI0036A4E890